MMLTTKGRVIDRGRFLHWFSQCTILVEESVQDDQTTQKKSQKIQVIKDSIEAVAGVLLQENED